MPSLTAPSSTQVLCHIFHASLNSLSSVPIFSCPALMIHYVPFLFGTTGSVCHTSRLKPYRKIFFSRGCGNLLIINLRMFWGFFSSQLWSCIFKQQHIVQKGELVKTWCFLLALFTLGSQENDKKKTLSVSSAGVYPPPVLFLYSHHLFPFLPPPYPLLSQFTLFPL